MYAEITLHRRVPSRFGSFTYKVPEGIALAKGQLVSVPFKKQKLSGIVRALTQESPAYPTKTIEKIFPLILSDHQLALADFLCTTYGCSFGQAIDLFIPDHVWAQKKAPVPEGFMRAHGASDIAGAERSQSRLCVQQARIPALRGSEPSELTKKISTLIETLTAQPTKKLLIEKTPLPRRAFYTELARHSKDGQVLILFPEVFDVNQFGFLGDVFHGQLPEREKARVWERVANSDARIIIGTRGALFLPFKNLRVIAFDREHHESYLEKRTPKYCSHLVAHKLAQLHEAPLFFISGAPRIETWHEVEKGNLESVPWEDGSLANVKMIDMVNQRRKGVSGLIAPEIIEKTAQALAHNHHVLFFVQRRGDASALFCADCRNTVRCETCRSPMLLYRDEHMECHSCRSSRGAPSHCPDCGSADAKKLGFGTERVEREIGAIFSHARIMRIDGDSTAKFSKNAGAFMQEMEEADILVATRLIDKALELPRLGLCIVLHPEHALNFPDFRAEERLWQTLTHLRHLVREGGEFVIQTAMPEHALFKLFTENRTLEFYKIQLALREKLHLPPFAQTKPNSLPPGASHVS